MTGKDYLEKVRFNTLEVLEQKYYAYDIINAFDAGKKDGQNLVKESASLPCVSDSHFTEFCCYLTGHDQDTISQMYQNWKRYR